MAHLLRQLNWLENPAISGLNRRASRVPLRSFRSVDDAVAYYTRAPLPLDSTTALGTGAGCARATAAGAARSWSSMT